MNQTRTPVSLAQIRSMMQRGMLQAARELCVQLVQQSPRNAEALETLGQIEEKLGEMASATRRYEASLKVRPGYTATQLLLARALHRQGQSQKALAICDDVLRTDPGQAAFIIQKASILEQRNDSQAAWETIEPLMNRPQVMPEAANVATRVLDGLGRRDEAIKWGTQAAEDLQLPAEARRTLWLHVAKVCDKVGRYDDAMAACRRAHQAVQHPFDPEGYRRSIDELIATYSGTSLRSLSRSNVKSELPVFVIGMPRSGTTLVEQIIHAHPQAFGAGELTDIDSIAQQALRESGSMHDYPTCMVDVDAALAQRLGAQYLTRLGELGREKHATRVVNKALQMYEHVGLIWQLLPGARIIHCMRDPLDTCLSCFTRHLNPQRMPFVTDLEHLGLAYREHVRLMDHWARTLDVPILKVQYEELVANQEPMSRRIIEFLGLPWDDRCLRYWEADRTVMTLSYDQVNRPIYDSSIGRWKHYEKHLGPLRRALGLDGAA